MAKVMYGRRGWHVRIEERRGGGNMDERARNSALEREIKIGILGVLQVGEDS